MKIKIKNNINDGIYKDVYVFGWEGKEVLIKSFLLFCIASNIYSYVICHIFVLLFIQYKALSSAR